jgi:hypothetical protein
MDDIGSGEVLSMSGGGGLLDKSEKETVGFFQYVFNFDDENKHAMLNMLQYMLLTIIPVLILLKLVKHYIPEDDDTKGSFEILAESVGQLIFIMLALWFINKVIYYIPTYSGKSYKSFNEINFILPFVLILATMQTKLGAKFQILIDRVMQKWHGKEGMAEGPQQGQGGQQQGGQQQQMMQHQPSQADFLPADRSLTQMPPGMPTKQARPDFNAMYQGGGQTPINGATPGGMGMMEPMAANEMGGNWASF